MKKHLFAIAAAFLCAIALTACPEEKKVETAKQENDLPKTESVQEKEPAPEPKAEPVKQEEKKEEPKPEPEIIVDKYDEIDLDRMQIHPLQYFPNETEMHPFGREDIFFYNIGFSKDGKFAYLISDPDDGKGGTTHTFYIQDLVTDSIVWRTSYEDESMNLQAVEKKMKEYKIDYVKTKFEKLPIKINGDTFDFKVTRKELPDLAFDFIPKADYTLTAIKNGNSKKTVTEVKDIQSYDTVVCGIIKNPYEDRVAVIVGNQDLIFEGLQYFYHVYGCDLKNNYK